MKSVASTKINIQLGFDVLTWKCESEVYIENSVKHLRWCFLRKYLTAKKPLTISAKNSILDVWKNSGYASVNHPSYLYGRFVSLSPLLSTHLVYKCTIGINHKRIPIWELYLLFFRSLVLVSGLSMTLNCRKQKKITEF